MVRTSYDCLCEKEYDQSLYTDKSLGGATGVSYSSGFGAGSQYRPQIPVLYSC